MDHEVARRHSVETLGVETKQVAAHVAPDRRDTSFHLGGEVIAELGAETVKAIVADDLFHRSVEGARPAAWADEQDDGRLGDGPQDPLDQGCAQESCSPGDEEPLTLECLCHSHALFLAWRAEGVYHLVSDHLDERTNP